MRHCEGMPTKVSADPDRFRHVLHRESPFGGNGGERIDGRNAFFQLFDCLRVRPRHFSWPIASRRAAIRIA